MDLLAIRYQEDRAPDALHVEVQASTGAIGWISAWTPRLQKELGIAAQNARKRTDEQMSECVEGWVSKKYLDPRVEKVKHALLPDLEWRLAFVHGDIKHQEEPPAIANHGVEVISLKQVIDELIAQNKKKGKDCVPFKTTSSTAADIAALVGFDRRMCGGNG